MVTAGFIIIHLQIPACRSLKEKRGRLKPVLERITRHLGLSAAEVDEMDKWQDAIIACSIVSNSKTHNQRVLQKIPQFIQDHFPDIEILDQKIELF